MGMPGRTWSGTADAYRYSHNGHEKQDEVFPNAQSAEYWMYDARIGRRWDLDPEPQISISNYASFANNPVLFADPFGDKITYDNIKDWVRTQYKRITDKKFNKEFKSLRDQYRGKVLDKTGTPTNQDKKLKISINNNENKNKDMTLSEAVKEHNTESGGGKNDGADYLWYNGNMDKTVEAEIFKGTKYGVTGETEPTKDKEFKFRLDVGIPTDIFDRWKFTYEPDPRIILSYYFTNNGKSKITELIIKVHNGYPNLEGGNGDPSHQRYPTNSLDHTNGWGTSSVLYKIEATSIPRFRSYERNIFGPKKNIQQLKEFSGTPSKTKIIKRNIFLQD